MSQKTNHQELEAAYASLNYRDEAIKELRIRVSELENELAVQRPVVLAAIEWRSVLEVNPRNPVWGPRQKEKIDALGAAVDAYMKPTRE